MHADPCRPLRGLLREGVECLEPPGECGPARIIVSRRVPEAAERECVYYLGSWGARVEDSRHDAARR